MARLLPLLTTFLLVAAAAAAREGPADPLWDLYAQGRFDEVIAEGKALINTGRGTAQVQLAVGRSLADTGRDAEALVFLDGAVADDPDRTWVYAWAQVYRGACHWRLGDAERARRAWRAARDADATANATRNAVANLDAFGLAERFDTWTRFTSEHFVFLLSDRLDGLDPAAWAREHEEAYARIRAWFGGGPAEPILFVVWADQAEADEAGMPTLGFARPELNLVHCRAGQTVGHEMTHVIAWHALRPTVRTGLINEGTAVRFDGTGRDRLRTAREAVAGSGAPPVAVAALWEDWSLLPPEVSYPVAGAWVDRLLARGGKERFLALFRDQGLAHARAVYGDDLADWMRAFDADLRP